MTMFNNQVAALFESAQSICIDAQKCSWNGEGWSPSIILGHLVDVDTEVWIPRFELMRNALNNQDPIPKLSWWEPDADKTEKKYAGVSLKDAQVNLLNSRQVMQSFLLALSIEERGALALHRTFGEVSIEAMLQVILDHDQEHRACLN